MTIGPEPVDRAHDLSIDVSARAPLGLLDRFIPPGVSISPSAFDTHRQAPISLILLWMIVDLAKSMRRPVLLNIRNNRDCPSNPLRFVTPRVDPLHRVLSATGFDPRDVDRVLGMLADDGTRRAELFAIADEPTGAFNEVRRETRRRWDEFSAAQEASRATVEARLAQSEAPVASVTPG